MRKVYVIMLAALVLLVMTVSTAGSVGACTFGTSDPCATASSVGTGTTTGTGGK